MNLGKYKAIRIIGSGSYGKIFQGISVATGDSVAIKMISLQGKTPDNIAEIEQEIGFMEKLSDPQVQESRYIVKYVDDFNITMGATPYKIIVMEDLSAWVTIDKYMESAYRLNPCNRIATGILKKIVTNLVMGLLHIHSQGIAHRDIKPENIMMDISYNIKYIDFGLSCSLKCAGTRGTPLYLPPETAVLPGDKLHLPPALSDDVIIKHNLKMGQRHDVWSLGLVMYQLSNLSKYPNNLPFDIPPTSNAYVFLSNMKKAPYKYPSNYTYEYAYQDIDFNAIITTMLTVNPEYRPDIGMIKDYIDRFNAA